MRERLTALDVLYANISTTDRARHETEPPPEINDGYAKLLFAYGYHQLESATRAIELEVAGLAQLEAHREDPVHAWLIDVLEVRCREPTTWQQGELSESLRARLDAFDRGKRYKVDRFREASAIVGGGAVDAIRRFARGGHPDDIATTTASYLAMVDRALTLAEGTEEEDLADAFVEASLQVRPATIEPEVAVSVLDRVLPRIERMADRRGLAYARAIAIAAHAAPTRVTALSEQVAPFLARESWNLDEMLAVLLESLATYHRIELAELWQCVPESVRATSVYRLGLLRLGAPPDKNDLFRASTPTDRSADELREATLDAFLARPFPERFAGRWASELYGSVTDDLATNSHFTYWVIRIVDRLVRGVLDP